MNAPGVRLDFVATRRPAPWAGLMLLLAGGVALGTVVEASVEIDAENARLATALEARQRELRVPAGPLDDPAHAERLERRARAAAELNARLDIPWKRLFDGVEAAASGDVALLAMTPDASARTVRLAGEARSVAALLEFTRRLHAAGYFSDVHLARHELKQPAIDKPVEFQLTARWQGA